MSKSKPQTTSWKERRRFHAMKLKSRGWKQREIATALDVSEGVVSRWLKRQITAMNASGQGYTQSNIFFERNERQEANP